MKRQRDAKYEELADWIRNQIRVGQLGPGEKLYSEHELSGMFGLSRQTVRHAVGMLEEEGLVKRVQGSGTFIEKRTEKRHGMTIAVISTYVDGYIFPPTLQGIVHTLTDAGYMAQIAFTNNRISDERRILEAILEKDAVDGVIVEAAKAALPNPNLEYYRELARRNVAVLFFNCKYPELDAPLVALDDVGVAEDAVSYLIRQGHRKIAGIFKSDDIQGPLRYKGYIQALLAAGLPTDGRRVLWIDTEDQKDMENIRGSMLRRLSGCTAVFCYNDSVAFSVLQILREEGIAVPEQMSLVSIDGAEQFLRTDFSVTTVPHPMERLGEMAAHNMLGMLEHPGFDGNFLYRPLLLERDSVRQVSEIESQEEDSCYVRV
ncbi:MAG: GntR family transcriptional regulator [Clostridiales bacterium]|nr:GntR family transcriptional regulator [Clostridiales bacterium]